MMMIDDDDNYGDYDKYVFSRVGKTLPTPQLLGHWATAPIAL